MSLPPAMIWHRTRLRYVNTKNVSTARSSVQRYGVHHSPKFLLSCRDPSKCRINSPSPCRSESVNRNRERSNAAGQKRAGQSVPIDQQKTFSADGGPRGSKYFGHDQRQEEQSTRLLSFLAKEQDPADGWSQRREFDFLIPIARENISYPLVRHHLTPLCFCSRAASRAT